MSWRWITVLVAVVLFAVTMAAGWYLHGGRTRGADLLRMNRFADARTELLRYQWLFGDDDELLLNLAEAWVRDDALLARPAAEKAIALLDRIDESSDRAAGARVQSGRLRLLIQLQPCRAERDFRTAIRLDPDLLDAHYMMWKTLDLTRRYHLVEPHFAACRRLVSAERLEVTLTDWYYSQFSTYAAAAPFDERLGFLRPGQTPDALTEYRRLIAFARNEPDCALNAAVLAHWCREFHVAEDQVEWMEKAWNKVDADTNPWVFAVLFDLLMEDGRFEDATAVFEAWPEPHSGFDYQTRRGIFLSEVKDDPEAAAAACRNAIAVWPGPVDWQVHHRLAGLLTRLGQHAEAEEVRERARFLEQRMEVDFHRRLRELLTSGVRRERIRRMAEFYEDIDRPDDAAAWRSLPLTGD